MTLNPLMLAAALATVIGASLAAGVGAELRRAAWFAVPLALLVAVVNPLVSREGLTLLVQGPSVPLYGKLDITLEAVVFGALAGLRVLVIVLAFAFYSAVVNPDRVLRGLRRVAPRSALTAALATRMLPLLARDAARMREAYGLRASVEQAGGRRVRLRRAGIMTQSARRQARWNARWTPPPRWRCAATAPAHRRADAWGERLPWSRDDRAFALSALVLAAVPVAAALGGAAWFDPYPLVDGGRRCGRPSVRPGSCPSSRCPRSPLALRRRGAVRRAHV